MKVRIWDLPTRLFHWLLAAAVLGLFVSGKVGGNAMVWHFRFGYAVLALLLFRVLWGLVGGRWSRFSSFSLGPAAIWAYLRGRAGLLQTVGHNPLGSLSVLALLALLGAQVGSGLFADDEIFNAGPLAPLVASETSQRLTAWHTGPGELLVMGWIALHVAAILFHRLHAGRNLLGPMLRGDKELAPEEARQVPASADTPATRALALLLLAASAGAVMWLVRLGS
ncbi:cytochrome b/b6 domain-containing protein [Caldimonas tepidiphila]|uniref:cytochrome b/b6 domain-containing protein n=1 Tax=Caldimonas tepidiphila TaxID=2315841 RepID=UPI000E5A5B2C|nr:cytochrome b/b6 domain-containing protein [Caldimonas tepidiphila]